MLPDRIGFLHLREMAGRAEQVDGTFRPAEIERLRDLLSESLPPADPGAELQVAARFVDHGHGCPELECRVTGALPLDCQRCLTSLQWPVELEFTLALVSSEDMLDRIGDRFDAVFVGEHGFSLREAVTDELLGSLPLAPMHAEVSECTGIERFLRTDSDTSGRERDAHEQGSSGSRSGESTNRPFAGLAALVKGSDGDTTESN